MAIVTIRVLSDDPSPVAVPGVLVEFYSTTQVLETSGTTDVDGEVQVSLPDETYEVLYYKQGVSILPSQPQQIVVDSLLSNIFEATAHIRTRPESTDPLLCKVSGYFRGVAGQAVGGVRLIFAPVKEFISLSGNLITPQGRAEFVCDGDGYFEFELLRDTKYNAYFVMPQNLFNTQPGKLDVITPDQPSVALDTLLFPLPVDLSLSATTLSLTAGAAADESITYTLTYSDGSTRSVRNNPWAYVKLENTDATIAEACFIDGGLSIKPLNPGTVTITTVRTLADRATIDPVPDYTTDSLVVTVS